MEKIHILYKQQNQLKRTMDQNQITQRTQSRSRNSHNRRTHLNITTRRSRSKNRLIFLRKLQQLNLQTKIHRCNKNTCRKHAHTI